MTVVSPRMKALDTPAKRAPPATGGTLARILAAARRILAEQGYDALTFETIAFEADVNKNTVAYYFRTKSALLATLLDEQVGTAGAVATVEPVVAGSPADHVDALEELFRRRLADDASLRIFLEVLPAALHDEVLRKRLVPLQARWIDEVLTAIGVDSQRATDEQRAFARLCLGLIDQLRLDGLINRNGATAQSTWSTLRPMLIQLTRAVVRVE